VKLLRRDCGQGVDISDASVTSGRWRGHDGDQKDEVILRTWSPFSIVSSRGRERRLEAVWQRCALGEHRYVEYLQENDVSRG
jgi:hypothetical protein